MKKVVFYFVIFTFCISSLNAQFTNDFEDCNFNGQPYENLNWGCGGGAGCHIMCSTDQNHTLGGSYSGLIPDDGTTDAVLDLGNKIFGTWGLEFWMYVPSNKEAYFNLQGTVPIGAGEWTVGNIFFNKDGLDPGRGFIDWSDNDPANDTYFDFPHDQWFPVVINVDISLGISAATWEFGVDGVVAVPAGTPYTDSAGSPVTSLGGIDFFSISTNNILYLDDIVYVNHFIPISDFEIQDDMESYTDGQPISGGHWTYFGCGGGAGCAIMSTSEQAHSGILSGLIPDDNTTDAVLDLGNKIAGTWGLEFFMYVPTGKEAYWNIQCSVPIGTCDPVIGHIFFNQNTLDPGRGFIDWGDTNATNDTYFDFPHDQWFKVVINVDISSGITAATWEFRVDLVPIVYPGTPFANAYGDYPPSFGGIEFFSISTDNTYYLDYFQYKNSFFELVDVDELADKRFSLYPNPVKDALYLKADEPITKISVYNMLGQEIYSKNINKLSDIIDTSNLTNGTYIVQVTIGNVVGSRKIVK